MTPPTPPPPSPLPLPTVFTARAYTRQVLFSRLLTPSHAFTRQVLFSRLVTVAMLLTGIAYMYVSFVDLRQLQQSELGVDP